MVSADQKVIRVMMVFLENPEIQDLINFILNLIIISSIQLNIHIICHHDGCQNFIYNSIEIMNSNKNSISILIFIKIEPNAGKPGEPGDSGKPGQKGQPGIDGTCGLDGRNGRPARNGAKEKTLNFWKHLLNWSVRKKCMVSKLFWSQSAREHYKGLKIGI